MSMPLPENLDGFASIYTNVGIESLAETYTCGYIYTNVSGGQPLPFLYGSKKSAIYANEALDVVISGGGEAPGRYITIVQAQTPDGTWQSVPITMWQNVAASANAYNTNRQISEDLSVVDPQHQVVSIVAPDWASPPHLPLRVVTHPGVDFTDGFHYGGTYIYTNVVT